MWVVPPIGNDYPLTIKKDKTMDIIEFWKGKELLFSCDFEANFLEKVGEMVKKFNSNKMNKLALRWVLE